jgi:uncharacterized protein (DUF433 family)
MNWQKCIQIAPGVRGAKPTLAGGMSEDEILRDFPSLTHEHIRAVLAYAAEREHR